jgi:spore coat-associated protein N
MSRLHALVHRPRRTLAALATVLVAVGITAASGANFTAASANPGNSFATGTLTMSNSKTGAFILQAGDMRPGDPATTGTVDIGNTGSLSGVFSLVRGTPVDSDTANALSAKLNVVVTDCGTFASGTPVCGDAGDVSKYSGTLAAMGTTAMGTFAAGEKHKYQFSVSVDSSAGNAYQGDSSVTQFDWNAS